MGNKASSGSMKAGPDSLDFENNQDIKELLWSGEKVEFSCAVEKKNAYK